MLKKPVAVILLLAGVVIAAFVGGYMATRVKVEPEDDFVVDVAEPMPSESAEARSPAGGGNVRRPAGGGSRPTVRAGNAVGGKSSTSDAPSSAPTGQGTGAPANPAVVTPTAGVTAAERPKELVVPAGQVITITLRTPISSERNKLEDPVEAFLAKDVLVSSHVAMPTGATVRGSVVELEKGGGFGKPAKIAVRFHTVTVAGKDYALSIDPIVAEAESSAGSTKKKVGWAAALGAGLGYVTGGVDGAVKGGVAGAGGGTAAAAVSKGQGAQVERGQTAPLMLAAPVTIAFD